MDGVSCGSSAASLVARLPGHRGAGRTSRGLWRCLPRGAGTPRTARGRHNHAPSQARRHRTDLIDGSVPDPGPRAQVVPREPLLVAGRSRRDRAARFDHGLDEQIAGGQFDRPRDRVRCQEAVRPPFQDRNRCSRTGSTALPGRAPSRTPRTCSVYPSPITLSSPRRPLLLHVPPPRPVRPPDLRDANQRPRPPPSRVSPLRWGTHVASVPPGDRKNSRDRQRFPHKWLPPSVSDFGFIRYYVHSSMIAAIYTIFNRLLRTNSWWRMPP